MEAEGLFSRVTTCIMSTKTGRRRPTSHLMTYPGTTWTAHRQAGVISVNGLDLTRARIANRDGRDVIALEETAGGFDLYLCDSPNGSANYEVTIAIPRCQ